MYNSGECIAIYSRKSKFTGKGESIGNQIELCKEYVRNMFGEDNVARCVVFEDEGFSGGNLKRPDFQKMMTEVRKRKYKAIIVYRLDRISRNISDFSSLIDELTRLDVSFVSIREQFDTSTPMGRAMMFIISVFSQLERETIAERIRDNMHELAKTGRWLGGNAPTGYVSESVSYVTVDGKSRKACKLKVIPEEAEIVRTIFDLYTELDSLTAVETELLRRRLKTKQGNDFTRFSVKGILQNPVYMVADEAAHKYFEKKNVYLHSEIAEFDGRRGMMAYNRTDQEKGKASVYLPMEEWIVAVGKHQGLIPSQQWIGVQESLERNKSKAYRKPRRNEALLTGLLFCTCGERMYPKLSQRTKVGQTQIYTYVCKLKERSKREQCNASNVKGNALDIAIMAQIKMLAEQEDCFIDQLVKTRHFYIGNSGTIDDELAECRAEQIRNQKTMDGLIDSLGLTKESEVKGRILKRIESLAEINRELDARIHELEYQISAEELSSDRLHQLQKKLKNFGCCVEEMSTEEKREAIRRLVRRVVWDGKTAHVLLLGSSISEREIGPSNSENEEPKTHWCEDSK